MKRLMIGLFSIIIAFIASACNLASTTTSVETIVPTTIVATIETSTVRPTLIPPTATPMQQSGTTAGETLACTPRTDWPTYTVRPGDTLFSIVQISQAGYSIEEIAAFNCLDDPNSLTVGQVLYVPNAIQSGELLIYWADTSLQNPPKREGSLIVACDTIVSPITSDIGRVSDDAALNLRNSLQLLFNGQSQDRSGWGGHGLSIESLTLDGDLVTVTIAGEFLFPGHCADGTLEAEMMFTIFEEPAIQRAKVFINGQNLRQVMDLRGTIGSDYVYTRAYLPPDWE